MTHKHDSYRMDIVAKYKKSFNFYKGKWEFSLDYLSNHFWASLSYKRVQFYVFYNLSSTTTIYVPFRHNIPDYIKNYFIVWKIKNLRGDLYEFLENNYSRISGGRKRNTLLRHIKEQVYV